MPPPTPTVICYPISEKFEKNEGSTRKTFVLHDDEKGTGGIIIVGRQRVAHALLADFGNDCMCYYLAIHTLFIQRWGTHGFPSPVTGVQFCGAGGPLDQRRCTPP